MSANAYAVLAADTSFKYVFSPESGADKAMLLSLLNSFCPDAKITDIISQSAVFPPRQTGEKQVLLNLHVVSSTGVHYLLEIQVARHVLLDERALFYACGTYSNQHSIAKMGQQAWYEPIQKVIVIQFVDYDSSRAKGASGKRELDTLVGRNKANPMVPNQFIKHYTMTDKFSEHTIDHLQMIQVDLPRFPMKLPTKLTIECFQGATLSEMDWWVLLFRYSNRFTVDLVHQLRNENIISDVMFKVFERLRIGSWAEKTQISYRNELVNIKGLDFMVQVAAAELAAEKMENMGRKHEEEVSNFKSRHDALQSEIDQLKKKLNL